MASYQGDQITRNCWNMHLDEQGYWSFLLRSLLLHLEVTSSLLASISYNALILLDCFKACVLIV